jgi:hypothetical protein
MLQKYLGYIAMLVLLTAAPYYAMAKVGQPPIAIKDRTIVECQNTKSIDDIKNLLQQYSDTLNPALINTTMNILSCTNKLKSLCNNKLTLIDYSLPSNQKRLWIFDLTHNNLLYHTYVSHGIKSGIGAPHFFSNIVKSKTSSIGVFETGKSYYGRDGLSLRLMGLEKHVNDNAAQRAVVIHSAWYVNEDFIRKYGRAGRSWGCPAIPSDQITSVIDTIKDQSLLVIYYPSNQWLYTSHFLTCDSALLSNLTSLVAPLPEAREIETRGDVLYGDISKTNNLDANVPVMCMSAENYQRLFKKPPPLSRMLRKQIYHSEYIALNLEELRQLDINQDKHINIQDDEGIAVLEFFLPELIKKGGHYNTEFKSANLGPVIEMDLTEENPVIITAKYRVTFKSTDQFIRWIGL